MDTTIKTGNMRVAHFSGTENVTGAAVAFDAAVSVSVSDSTVASYADIDGVSGKFIAVGAGAATFTATASSGGKTATTTGTITVSVADDGSFTLNVAFDDETPAA
jgi:uncharacterized protein YjdB